MAARISGTCKKVIAFLKSVNVMFSTNSQGQVEDVDLRDLEETDDAVRHLQGLPNLKDICLQDTSITDEGLEHLSKITSLEEVDLRSCKRITDKGMKHLSRLTNVKKLDLYSTRIGDQGLECLSTLRILEDLDIQSTRVTDGGLQLLESFPKLESLDVGGTSPVTDAGLEYLKPLKHLEWLTISDSRFTDAALAHLKYLTRLKLFYLLRTPITGSGFKDLTNLPRLEVIDARYAPIGDQSLKYFGRMKNLKELGLEGTKVTDKGLKYLSGLSKLKALELEETRVTKKGKAELKKALPRCSIFISADQAEENMDKYDTEYFWNNPPRCVAGFSLKALREQPAITFQLICRCGGETGRVLGYPLSAYNCEYSGPEFVSPLSFRCCECQKTTEIIDTDIHGYDGELGSPTNIRGKGRKAAFQCQECHSEEMSVMAHFQFDGGELELKEDEPSISVQDFFGGFAARARCAKCGAEFSIADFELA